MMKDYRGKELKVGDKVAIYFGYNCLETGWIHTISKGGNNAKVHVQYTKGDTVISKWKPGDCMVKLED